MKCLDHGYRWLFIAITFCGIAAVAHTSLQAEEGADGFTALFDGKSLDGWDGNPDFWRIEDGTITGQTTKDNPTKGNTFLIYRDGEFANFELQLQFRIVGGNSGIQYRSKEADKWVIGGYQADFDAPGQYSGILYEERGRGILAMRGNKVVINADGSKENVGQTTPEAEILDAIKKEEWNDYRVIADGNHLIHEINGKVTVDVTDNQVEKRAASGLLALQLHAGPPMLVQFKNIRIKKLTPNADEGAAAGSVEKKK
ncbi:MAG: DUF1080 domain-containing protein [Planctomycetales bacterium]|nr:DUF1080 domain-containing protein [Planctomycetales bacterium]